MLLFCITDKQLQLKINCGPLFCNYLSLNFFFVFVVFNFLNLNNILMVKDMLIVSLKHHLHHLNFFCRSEVLLKLFPFENNFILKAKIAINEKKK